MTTRPSVLVTGANSGIGKEIASHLARSGYDVAINYKIDAPAAEALAQELRAHGGPLHLGLRRPFPSAPTWTPCSAPVLADFGKLDALVNNAAVQVWEPLLEVAEADWDRVLATNLRGVFSAPSAPLAT
jgi:NAD(P)-dependent dehydrogenase (short-subunit alcohol dehydrogenase family)